MRFPVYLKKESRWVYERLLTIVAAKKLIGINTSVDHEAGRILENYFLKLNIGEVLDKEILK